MPQFDKNALLPFAHKYHVSVDTVIKRYKKGEIPGIYLTGHTFCVMEGTRYPYNMNGKTRTTNISTKKFYILDAIQNDYYTDAARLNLEEVDFEDAIKEFIDHGWINKRKCENQYGTNKYSISFEGSCIVDKIKEKIATSKAKFIGSLIGSIIDSQLKG